MPMMPEPGSFLDTARITTQLGVAPGAHVADLGCGTGYFAISFAKVVGPAGIVFAVDVQTEPLDSVRVKAQSAGLSNVREIRADLEVLGGTGIPDASTDLALLANTLFQSSKRPAMVAEAVRVLKQGGRLAIVEWKKGSGSFGPADDVRLGEDEVKQLAIAAGLTLQSSLDAGAYYFGFVFVKP